MTPKEFEIEICEILKGNNYLTRQGLIEQIFKRRSIFIKTAIENLLKNEAIKETGCPYKVLSIKQET